MFKYTLFIEEIFKITTVVGLMLTVQNVIGQDTIYHLPPSKTIQEHAMFKYDYKPISLKVVTQDQPSPNPIALHKVTDEKGQLSPQPINIVITKADGEEPDKPIPMSSPNPSPTVTFLDKEDDCLSVAEAIATTPEISTLFAALQATGLDDAQPGIVATILAPTNDAFEILVKTFNTTLEQVLADPQLQNILSYHVIPGGILLSADFTDGAEFPTLLGQNLTVSLEGGEVTFIGTSNSAKIVTADLETCGDIIHTVDTVLLPDFSKLD